MEHQAGRIWMVSRFRRCLLVGPRLACLAKWPIARIIPSTAQPTNRLTDYPRQNPPPSNTMRSSVLRLTRQQFLTGSRRYASTSTSSSSNAAAKAKAGAAKAQEAATKYAGKAIKVLGKSGESFAKLAAKTGGRSGEVLKKIESALLPIPR